MATIRARPPYCTSRIARLGHLFASSPLFTRSCCIYPVLTSFTVVFLCSRDCLSKRSRIYPLADSSHRRRDLHTHNITLIARTLTTAFAATDFPLSSPYEFLYILGPHIPIPLATESKQRQRELYRPRPRYEQQHPPGITAVHLQRLRYNLITTHTNICEHEINNSHMRHRRPPLHQSPRRLHFPTHFLNHSRHLPSSDNTLPAPGIRTRRRRITPRVSPAHLSPPYNCLTKPGLSRAQDATSPRRPAQRRTRSRPSPTDNNLHHRNPDRRHGCRDPIYLHTALLRRAGSMAQPEERRDWVRHG